MKLKDNHWKPKTAFVSWLPENLEEDINMHVQDLTVLVGVNPKAGRAIFFS